MYSTLVRGGDQHLTQQFLDSKHKIGAILTFLWGFGHASGTLAMPLGPWPCLWDFGHASGTLAMPLGPWPCLWDLGHASGTLTMPLGPWPCLWDFGHASGTLAMPLGLWPCLWNREPCLHARSACQCEPLRVKT